MRQARMRYRGYRPLNLPKHVTRRLANLVASVFDEQLAEVHLMMRTPTVPHAPVPVFAHSMTIMLLTIVAGVSSVLATIPGEPGKQFVGAVATYFPWDINPPEGVSEQGAARVLYDVFRNPLVHAAGLMIQGSKSVKFGVTFKDPEVIEREDYLPTKAVPIVRSDAIVLYLDEFYWSVRQMIVRTMADERHAKEIDEWIAKGRFARRG